MWALATGTVLAVVAAAGGVANASQAGVASPRSWAVATPVQHAYVVLVNDTSGTDSYPDSQAAILGRIDAVLARWSVESEQQISSFTRAGAVQSFDADCSKGSAHSAAWGASDTLFPGVSFSGSSGNHLVVVAPQGCGGGVGSVGSDANGLSSGGKVYVDDNPSKGTQSLLHELGHNFSLEHAHNIYCDTAGTCTQEDYGDDYAIMGTTEEHTPPWVPAALDSFERTHLGIAQPCEIPTLALASGQRSVTATYDLFGRGSSTGVRGLRLTDPVSGVTTMLDWRDHAGRDAGAYYGSSLAAAQRESYNTGVTVQQVSSDGDSTILQGHLADGKTYASTSAGTYLHAYTAGQTYTAGGTSARVEAMPAGNGTDATSQVTVTLTGSQSGDGPSLPTQTGGALASGAPDAGATLTALASGWTAGSCYRYQWFDDGTPIEGARSASYVVPPAAAGHQFTVAITGQQTGYQPLTALSQPASAAPACPGACTPGGNPEPAPTGVTPPGTAQTAIPAPAFSRAVLAVGDRTARATYVLAGAGDQVTVTLTATAPGHRTVSAASTRLRGTLSLLGLLDGVTYSFTLTASNGGGASATTLGRHTPARVPSLALRTTGQGLAPGARVSFFGTLRNGRAGVANRVVTLSANIRGRTVRVAKVRTDRHGRFAVTLRPLRSALYAAAATLTLDNHVRFRAHSKALPVRVA